MSADSQFALAEYLYLQRHVEHMRKNEPPSAPWPAADNPMLEHLAREALDKVGTSGVRQAINWLAVHAWFEGGIDHAATHPRAEFE